MKILIRQFLGKNHSWAHIGWEIANSLIDKKHNVHLFSTDGIKHLPDNLKPYLIGYVEENSTNLFGRLPDKEYDLQISYTAMKNFPHLLSSGSRNRFGIWCYEWSGKNVLPKGFAKFYKYCDRLLPPSEHAKKVFVDSGIPEDHITVVPHGINKSFIDSSSLYKLNSQKKFKVLCNIAQPHMRKNIYGILEAWGRAFTKKDDVSLILKIVIKKPTQPFEVNFQDIFSSFNKKYPNHAEIVILSSYIDDISSLYRSCNAYISMSNAESFLLPALEALATNKILLVSASGGQMDFCNKNNSLLINGKIVQAQKNSMYWEYNSNAEMFQPNIDCAAEKLLYAFNNEQLLLEKFAPSFQKIRDEYTWDNVTNKIINLCTNS